MTAGATNMPWGAGWLGWGGEWREGGREGEEGKPARSVYFKASEWLVE